LKTIIVDTHAFIWFISGDKKLSKTARKAIEKANTIYLSVASIWEMAIKISLGKLELGQPFDKINEEIVNNGFELLDINFQHALALSELPFHHKDPFDRMILAQAMTEKIPIISIDQHFPNYDVNVIW